METTVRYPVVIGKLLHTGEFRLKPDKEEDDEPMICCECCGKQAPEYDCETVLTRSNIEQKWCPECVAQHATECGYCGELLDKDSNAYTVYTDDGSEETWCSGCFTDNSYHCDHCGQDCESTNNVETGYDETENWCQSCVNDNAYECERCGTLTDCDSAVYNEEGREVIYCRYCTDEYTYRCDCCGEQTTENFSDENDLCLCHDCYAENYTRCDNCEHLYPNDEIRACHGRYLCPDCMEEDTEFIYDYHHHGRPRWNYHKLDFEKDFLYPVRYECIGSLVYLGFELESGGADCLQDADDAAGQAMRDCSVDGEPLAFCEHDGSIPDHGFELISHPCTLLYHKQAPWAKTFQGIAGAGLRSHDLNGYCGLHVHVNRSFMTFDRWTIVDWFVRKYRTNFEIFSRRQGSQYARFKDRVHFDEHVNPTSPESLKPCCIKAQCGCSTGHYDALNFQHSSTVEFRMFRGTLRYHTVMATLEFVHAVVSFIKQLKVHELLTGNITSWQAFIRYMSEQPELYREAIEYSRSKGLWTLREEAGAFAAVKTKEEI